MGGGSNSQSSSSRPLTGPERANIFNWGMDAIAGSSQGIPYKGAVSPYEGYTAVAPQTLTGGDYNRLQDDVLSGYTAGIDRAKAIDSERLDADLAKRGIWSSGLAVRAQNDLTERYAPQYTAAGGQATQARYGLQSQELGAANMMNASEADKVYQSKWRPAEYLAGLWNGTGGAMSSGSGSGWNFSI